MQISGSTDNADTVEYTLQVALVEPPACDDDDLGDTASGGNDSPATAFLLDPTGEWPDQVNEDFEFPTDSISPSSIVTLCASDDDWYRIEVTAGFGLGGSVVTEECRRCGAIVRHSQ